MPKLYPLRPKSGGVARVGRFDIRRGQEKGTIRITIAEGPRKGEGGEFPEKEFEQVIRQFYTRRF